METMQPEYESHCEDVSSFDFVSQRSCDTRFLFICAIIELAPILRSIEVSLRGSDQSIGTDGPFFIAADAHMIAVASGPGVGTYERPVIFGCLGFHDHIV